MGRNSGVKQRSVSKTKKKKLKHHELIAKAKASRVSKAQVVSPTSDEATQHLPVTPHGNSGRNKKRKASDDDRSGTGSHSLKHVHPVTSASISSSSSSTLSVSERSRALEKRGRDEFDAVLARKQITALCERYKLEPHPEGGYFKRTYESSTLVAAVPESAPLPVPVSSAMYYLVPRGSVSKFHRLSVDELWFYHMGEPIVIVEINPESGRLKQTILGPDILNASVEQQQQLQYLVPKGRWFGCVLLSALQCAKSGFPTLSCHANSTSSSPPRLSDSASSSAPFSFPRCVPVVVPKHIDNLRSATQRASSVGFCFVSCVCIPSFTSEELATDRERTVWLESLFRDNSDMSRDEITWLLDQLCPAGSSLECFIHEQGSVI